MRPRTGPGVAASPAQVTPMRAFPLVLALLLPLAALPAQADHGNGCGPVSITAYALHSPVGYNTGRKECGSPTHSLLLPGTSRVEVTYRVQEPGIAASLVALVEGLPSGPLEMPLHEQGSGSSFHYRTDPVWLPDGFTGDLTATILRDDVPVGTTTAHAPL